MDAFFRFALITAISALATHTAWAGDIARGRTLYVAQCQSCHGGPTNPTPRQANTVAALNSAIRTQASMRFLDAMLSAQDRDDIASYIANPSGGADVAPSLSYLPAVALNLFGSPSTEGSTAQAAISVTPSEGAGSGANGTTVLTCSASAGFSLSTSTLSFVGNTTAARSLPVSCVRSTAVQNGSLSCQEARGSASAIAQNWTLTCPAGTAAAAVAPQLSYSTPVGSAINLTSPDVVVGMVATTSLDVTPRDGSGTGSAATSTLTNCVADAASGIRAGRYDLSFVGNTTVVQRMTLSCPRSASAKSGFLSCNESIGSTQTTRRWPINCPAAVSVPAPPVTAYYPGSTGTLLLTGSPSQMNARASAFVQMQPVGGAGTGPESAASLSACALSGADSAQFSVNSLQTATVLPGDRYAYIDVSCTRSAGVRTATLQCNEKIGNAAETQRRWTVSCPAADAISPQTGWYWNASLSGSGYFIENRNGSIFMGGFLYLPTGPNWWFVAQGPLQASSTEVTVESPMYALEGGQSLTGVYRGPRTLPPPGSVKLQWTRDDQVTMTWPGGVLPLTRFPIFDLVSVKPAQPGAPEPGWWWNRNESGRGFAIGFEGDAIFIVGFMYDENGRATWYTSNGKMTAPNLYVDKWLLVENGQALGAPYKPAQVTNGNVGSLRLEFSDARNATITLPDGRTVALTRQPQ